VSRLAGTSRSASAPPRGRFVPDRGRRLRPPRNPTRPRRAWLGGMLEDFASRRPDWTRALSLAVSGDRAPPAGRRGRPWEGRGGRLETAVWGLLKEGAPVKGIETLPKAPEKILRGLKALPGGGRFCGVPPPWVFPGPVAAPSGGRPFGEASSRFPPSLSAPGWETRAPRPGVPRRPGPKRSDFRGSPGGFKDLGWGFHRAPLLRSCGRRAKEAILKRAFY
jgi:hypothetical protein